MTCDREGDVRGLCRSCYASATGSIKRGEYTEEQLVKKGMILEGKRSRVSPWLLKAEEVMG